MTDTVVAPPANTVITPSREGHNSGLEHLVTQSSEAHASRDITRDVLFASKDNAVAISDVQTSVKDIARQNEQLHRETQLMVLREAQTTREQVNAVEMRAKDASISLLQAKLIAKGVI